MQRKNPNSSIRRGYGFEDVFVLQCYADWLKKPEAFKEVRIQCIPDGLEGQRFAIDDVVVFDASGKCSFYQLKHKQDPACDLWTFDALIEKGLIRWIKSFDIIDKNILKQASLLTNGHPAPELVKCLTGNKISYAKLLALHPAVVQRLRASVSLTSIKRFLSGFSFLFNYPEINQIEKEIRHVYYNELKATKDGVDNLLLEIVRQGGDPYPRSLSLAEIRNLLSWDNPRPLNQDFEIPADFEFFDRKKHEEMLKTVTDPKGGIQVIIGKPGTGKSTYLSKLYHLLKAKKFPVARHHYHLNPRDTSFRDRLNADRVKEGLRAEFKKEKEGVLGDLSFQNTTDTPLKTFIQAIAKHYAARAQCFVLIVDGLDHVLREGKSSDALREFLDEVLYPQAGFSLIIGTQEMTVLFFPNVIYSYCPKENWIEIKGLKKEAVAAIVSKHITTPQIEWEKEMFRLATQKLFAKTTGNPLHLRYALTQLLSQGTLTDAHAIDSLLPYKGDIKEYYADLWRQLPAVAKSICFGIAFLDFRLQEEELFQLAGYFTRYPAEIQTSFAQMRHLIKNDLFGISVYHNSFLVFLLQSEDLLQQKNAIYKQIRRWLKQSANADLKWAELPKIEYYLGNDKPLLQINKQWVVDNFIRCREEYQIEKLLGLGLAAAFAKNNYQKVIELRLLETYFANRYYNLYDTLQKIWVTAFSLQENPLTRIPEFQQFNHYQLKEILVALHAKGKIHVIPEAVTELFNDFLHDHSQEQPAIIKSWIALFTALDAKTITDAHRFIIQGRASSVSPSHFAYYCKLLLEHKKYKQVEALLKTSLSSEERESIAIELVENDLLNNTTRWASRLKSVKTPVVQFYHALHGTTSSQPRLVAYTAIPAKIEAHSHANDELVIYRQLLYNGIILTLNGKAQTVDNWIKKAGNDWPLALACAALKTAVYLGTSLINKTTCEMTSVLIPFDTLRPLDYDDDHDIYEFRRVILPFLIEESLRIYTYVRIHSGNTTALSAKDCQLLFANKWLYKDRVIALFTAGRINISDAGFDQYMKAELEKMDTTPEPFKDRADRLIQLCMLARDLGKKKSAMQLLSAAAQNIIAYGNHKDMQLYSVMRSIEVCAKAGSKKATQWLRDIGKFVVVIKKVTDRDETGSFIYDYSSLLAASTPNLLYNFYFHTVKKRKYDLSDAVFGDCLSTLPLGTYLGNAIAGTAVDKHSYPSLEYLAQTNRHAKQILRNIQSVFGKIDYGDDTSSYSSPLLKDKEPKTDPSIYQSVPPSALKEHFENIKGSNYYHRRGQQSDYLLGWCRYWLSKKPASLTVVIEALQGITQENFATLQEEVLLFIYPFARKVNKAFAFDCMVWAFANSSSWSGEYIQKMDASQKKWKQVIEDYPARIDEFFWTSIQYSGRHYGDNDDAYYISIPKATQFFVDCGRLAIAESITAWNIQLLPQLFPGLPLTDPVFIAEEQPITHFELLISRLTAISPIVRERSGWHLAQLLAGDKKGTVHADFLKALKKVTLENIAGNYLLIAIFSLRIKKSFSYQHLSVQVFEKNLNVFGRSLQLLLSQIAFLLKVPFVFDLPFVTAFTNQEPKLSREQFDKKLSSNLPYAYNDYLETLQSLINRPLWKLWCNKFEETCDNLELTESTSDRDYGNEQRDYMAAKSTIFADVLRTTFSEVVDILYDLHIITSGDLTHFTLRNLAVDPSVWRIALGIKPAWWPRFSAIPVEKKKFTAVALTRDLKDLLLTDTKEQLLHASGAIAAVNKQYSDTLEGTINIMPFAYTGSIEDLHPVQLFEALSEARHSWYPVLERPYNFGTFDNPLQFNADESTIAIGNARIQPLMGGIILIDPHMWQYYRWRYDFSLPAPLLAGDLLLDTKSRHIRYLQGKKAMIKIFDFADGLRGRAGFRSVVPSANYSIIDKEYLSAMLQENGLQMAWVIRQKHFIRDYNFSRERQEVITYEILQCNK